MNSQAQQTNGGNLVVFQQPRLPYHDAISERFGVDRAGWKALTEAIFPNAKTADSVIMALSYCRARKLDPFKRPVHIVPMWSSAARTMVETVWPGISELRTTAFRTGQYAGKGETEFGPSIEREFKGTFKETTKTVTVKFPEWARVRIKRMLNGKECEFVSPKVFWLEAYAKWGNTDVPNEMWAKRPSGQLEKCVEAAGLRCAFPEEIGNDLSAEEMEGQGLIDDHAATPSQRRDDGPPAPATVRSIEHKAQVATQAVDPREVELVAGETIDHETGEVTWGEPTVSQGDEGIPGFLDRRAPPTQPGEAVDEDQWIKDLTGAFSSCETLEQFTAKQRSVMAPMKSKIGPATWSEAQRLAEDTYHRVRDN